jgi:hypothetical protein
MRVPEVQSKVRNGLAPLPRTCAQMIAPNVATLVRLKPLGTTYDME